jgi:ABC-type phosphate transport system substrate-binding protein
MRQLKRITMASVAALTISVGAPASAATVCPIKGSDTLYDVMGSAISAYRAEVNPSNYIQYVGTGSGNGEKALIHTATPWQLIAPMSRNITASTNSACEALSGVGSGNCKPEIRNVLGLDAAMIIVNPGVGKCPNLNIGTDSSDPNSAPTNNDLALILGGKGGTGDWVACSAPERVAAIDRLLSCNKVSGTLEHFYRRDDNSGTSDTMREKLKIARFCNGESKPPSPGGTNVQNPDNDPIRGPCPASGPGLRKVRCTFTDPSDTANFGKDCQDTPNASGCTAGFVIAITEGDPGISDITMTIAYRVLGNANVVGYAGREAARKAPVSGQPAAGPNVNTITAANSNVRQDKYMLSRRLWLADAIIQNDTLLAHPETHDPVCAAAEAEFFSWATDALPNVSAKTGRENIDPIMVQWGFIPCTDDHSDPVGNANLCSKVTSTGYPFGEGTAAKCTASSISGGVYVETTCSSGTVCCSTGASCPSSGKCPVPAGRPTGAACSYDAQCASGSCDPFATTSVGQCL